MHRNCLIQLERTTVSDSRAWHLVYSTSTPLSMARRTTCTTLSYTLMAALYYLISNTILASAQTPAIPTSELSISLFDCDPSTTWPDGGRCASPGELVTYGQTTFISDVVLTADAPTTFVVSTITQQGTGDAVAPAAAQADQTGQSTTCTDSLVPAATSNAATPQRKPYFSESPTNWGGWGHGRLFKWRDRGRGGHHHQHDARALVESIDNHTASTSSSIQSSGSSSSSKSRSSPTVVSSYVERTESSQVSSTSSGSTSLKISSSSSSPSTSAAPSSHVAQTENLQTVSTSSSSSSLQTSSPSSTSSSTSNSAQQSTESSELVASMSPSTLIKDVSSPSSPSKSKITIESTITISPVPSSNPPSTSSQGPALSPQSENALSVLAAAGRDASPVGADGAPAAGTGGCTRAGNMFPAGAGSFSVPSSCFAFEPITSSPQPDPSVAPPSAVSSEPASPPPPAPSSQTNAPPSPAPPPSSPAASSEPPSSNDDHSTWAQPKEKALADGQPNGNNPTTSSPPTPQSADSRSDSAQSSSNLSMFSSQADANAPSPTPSQTPAPTSEQAPPTPDTPLISPSSISLDVQSRPITHEPVPVSHATGSSEPPSQTIDGEGEEMTTLHTTSTSTIWLTTTVPRSSSTPTSSPEQDSEASVSAYGATALSSTTRSAVQPTSETSSDASNNAGSVTASMSLIGSGAEYGANLTTVTFTTTICADMYVAF